MRARSSSSFSALAWTPIEKPGRTDSARGQALRKQSKIRIQLELTCNPQIRIPSRPVKVAALRHLGGLGLGIARVSQMGCKCYALHSYQAVQKSIDIQPEPRNGKSC